MYASLPSIYANSDDKTIHTTATSVYVTSRNNCAPIIPNQKSFIC